MPDQLDLSGASGRAAAWDAMPAAIWPGVGCDGVNKSSNAVGEVGAPRATIPGGG